MLHPKHIYPHFADSVTELKQSFPHFDLLLSLNDFQKVTGEFQITEQMRKRTYTLSSF